MKWAHATEMDISCWFYVKWWRWTMPSFLEICLNKRIILILTIGLPLRYLTSSLLKKKWIRLVYTLEMDTSCPFLCQVVKMNNVQFPWTINIKYNNTYSDDHEHLTIFYTHFFREYPMRTHPKNTQMISANPFFMRRSLTSLGHKNRSQK